MTIDWHTGTPSEPGKYLVWFRFGGHHGLYGILEWHAIQKDWWDSVVGYFRTKGRSAPTLWMKLPDEPLKR